MIRPACRHTGATIHPHEEVEAWLHTAGFTDIRHQGVGPVAGSAIVEAVKA